MLPSSLQLFCVTVLSYLKFLELRGLRRPPGSAWFCYLCRQLRSLITFHMKPSSLFSEGFFYLFSRQLKLKPSASSSPLRLHRLLNPDGLKSTPAAPTRLWQPSGGWNAEKMLLSHAEEIKAALFCFICYHLCVSNLIFQYLLTSGKHHSNICRGLFSAAEWVSEWFESALVLVTRRKILLIMVEFLRSWYRACGNVSPGWWAACLKIEQRQKEGMTGW